MSDNNRLPDLLTEGLDIVFVGTAAGTKSATRQAYYANDSNRFYNTVHKIGLTSILLKPEEYKELLNYRIGITDLFKGKSGLDRTLTKGDYDVEAFRKKIEILHPKILAFNGKRAAKVFFDKENIEYGRQAEMIGNTVIFVLPSTSGMASRWWDERYWKDVALKIYSLSE